MAHVVRTDQPQDLIAADCLAAPARLRDLVRTLRDIDGIEADWRLQIDLVPAGILAAAEEASADLIVAGPHKTRWQDAFTLTSAEPIMRQGVRPVLVAIDAPTARHRRSLLAMDLDDAWKMAAPRAMAMGLFEQTTVVVMHAFSAPAMHMMKRAFISISK